MVIFFYFVGGVGSVCLGLGGGGGGGGGSGLGEDSQASATPRSQRTADTTKQPLPGTFQQEKRAVTECSVALCVFFWFVRLPSEDG